MQSDEGFPGKKITMYHQTDQNCAELILVSQKMMRGVGGSVGAAIYFALTPESTNKKAHRRGVILSALVTVGRSKVISNKSELDNFTHSQLKTSGYDSVLGKCFLTGDEYVVYNWGQVTDIKIVQSSCPIFAQKFAKVECPHGANCYRTNPDHLRDFSHPQEASQCEFGVNCYRTNPDHIKNCHPPGFQPKPKSGGCPFGARCYRQNPDHIKQLHPPGFIPAPKP